MLVRELNKGYSQQQKGRGKIASRDDILDYVAREYGVKPDYPWSRTPGYAILRHPHNKKWFGAIMDITQDKLGLESAALIDAMNLKCDPLLIAALNEEPGIFPAYHMNKTHWITVALNNSIENEKVYDLIDISYELTK